MKPLQRRMEVSGMSDTNNTVTRSEREMKRMFAFMKGAAWTALVVGVAMCLWDVGHFSDENITLMAGIGFMVGSVFIYTIGTAMYLVEKRRSEQQPKDTILE
jgi:hypothetical protein